MKAKLILKEELYHHHSDGIFIKYSGIKSRLEKVFEKQIDIEFKTRTNKKQETKGISAKLINIEIRKLLENLNDIRFEVEEHEGVYYFGKRIAGFDFAFIDDKVNLHNLFNLCFGRRALNPKDAQKEWSKFLDNNPAYQDLANELNLTNEYLGKDIITDKKNPIILGEIQFGNWALAYRDFFKVLKANTLTNVDALIYLTPTGQLESLLSGGIVTFNKTKDIIEEFSKVINVPIWLVGIDIEYEQEG